MAQPSVGTPIQIYYSPTASNVPVASNLAYGELAINIADGKLYFKNTSNAVTLLASTASSTATVSSVNASGGSTGLTFSGGPITTSGTLTMAGTLNVSNGGTGVTTITGIVKGNGAGAMTSAVAGTDYAAPTPTNNYILTGNSAGGFSNVPAPVNGYVLGWNGTTYTWVAAPAATTAASIAGGLAGEIVYQTGTSSTGFSPVGNTGQTLTSGGTGQPTWVDPTSGTFNLDLTNLNGGSASTTVWNPVYFNCGGAT
jgi:hypothetical protein